MNNKLIAHFEKVEIGGVTSFDVCISEKEKDHIEEWEIYGTEVEAKNRSDNINKNKYTWETLPKM